MAAETYGHNNMKQFSSISPIFLQIGQKFQVLHCARASTSIEKQMIFLFVTTDHTRRKLKACLHGPSIFTHFLKVNFNFQGFRFNQ